ncbi:PfEMP1 [Plasmodium falciparum Dd2]|uniref:PfEMP1 n=1 Tax=Plasmodium falciparum (isolate Dd2) TaxID=57267 RepID=A0A0L7LWY1_PLAF4|nr:PfEMP1 [Plasmodium falciparum Dd2]
MGPKAAAPDYSSAKDAKELLDRIGKDVHDEVKTEAQTYDSYLKGKLQHAASTNWETAGTNETCKLVEQYYERLNGKRYPCGNTNVNRFSDKEGAQCANNRIEGNNKASNGKDFGACAPYRRLSLCKKNLSHMDENKINNTDNLLLEVCMAAKYEGDSIKTPYTIYKETNPGTASQLCTVLARSFADIGDIVRGRDLYLGNPQESAQRKQLEKNLKEIFKEIHNNLNNPKAKTHYEDKDPEKNFFKLREDWWTANRNTVWEAITCGAPDNAEYFRKTCSSESVHYKKCHCNNGDVPTYFDYVPQYLRWFEEWAEDFCRKKNKKIKDVKRNCREKDKNSEERYCSRNGYDCEKTVRARGKLRYGKQCISCLYGCNPYVEWIEKQKEQFDKQKNKYDEEMQKYTNEAVGSGSRKKRDATTKVYDGYEKIFYEKLKGNYSEVNKFLEKLSNEEICKEVKDDKEGKIHFEKVNTGGTAGSGGASASSDTSGTNDINNGTFYRSEYCQPCPLCGMKKKDGKWEHKKKGNCTRGNLYKPTSGQDGTPIRILKSGEGHDDIEEKLNKFCAEKNGGGGSGTGGRNSNSSLYDPWKCYQIGELKKDGQGEEDEDDEVYDKEVEDAGGLCILKNEKHVSGNNSSNEPAEFQKTFNDFFYYWVVHMLKDSIYWRTKKIKGCLENGNRIKCRKGCKGDCDCFESWVKQKGEEWKNIVKHFKKQKDIEQQTRCNPIVTLELNLKEEFYKEKSEDGSEEGSENSLDAKEIQHLRQMLQETAGDGLTCSAPVTGKKTIMDKLIDYEKDEADLCLDTHEKDEDCSYDDDDHEEPPIVKSNPCATPSGSTYPVLANKVAHQMHELAKLQLSIRGGRRNLRADATKGQYRGSNGIKLTGGICSIDEKYSNAGKNKSNDPCNGKNENRFNIGEKWKTGSEVKMSDTHSYMPPRRQHFCTSNLEHLHKDKEGKFEEVPNGKASHSLLGDVLIAAKKEAEFIKKKYQENKDNSGQNGKNAKNGLRKDQATTCRAIRYSFADIGDIIKGTDMWDEDGGEKTTQSALKTVFDKIKDELKHQLNGKYEDNSEGKHLQLRKDWWTANRYQVWNAMKCAIITGKISCHGMPVEDYIPQRLRWMTEWAEWFCKEQYSLYDELEDNCRQCKGNDQCTQNTNECKTCKAACAKYTENIKKWEPQWKQIKAKYEELYLQARTVPDGTVIGDVSDQQVLEFFKELQKEIKNGALNRPKRSTDGTNNDPTLTSPYKTAAGYIHQELGRTVGCQKQKQFCEKKHGDTSSNGEDNTEYTFKQPPPDYETACGCESRPQAPKKVEEKKDACTIVETLLNGKETLDTIDNCNKKNDKTWDCKDDTFNQHNKGACMPPRRQSLCIYNLKESDQTGTKEQLREAFIKCASKETFFAWKKYKEDKQKNKNDEAPTTEPDDELMKGTIPEEFKRIMYYTYGDYRDFLFGTDISKGNKDSDIENVKNNINKLFPNGTSDKGKSPQEWWQTYGKDIWKGMVCGLSHHINNGQKKELRKNFTDKNQYSTISRTLEDFASRPPFLRWFTEWADEFCTERGIKIKELEKGCDECIVSDSTSGDGKTCNNKDKCDKCKVQCQKYETWLTKWKDNYNKQSEKYFQDKNDKKFQSTSAEVEVNSSTHAYDYLQKALTKICPNGTCSPCMDKESESTSKEHNKEASRKSESDNSRMPASLDDEPTELNGKCSCTLPPDACKIAEDILKSETDKKFAEACALKYGKKSHVGWNCNSSIFKPNNDGACMPPRRQKLYIHKLENFSGGTSPETELGKAFIESAAVETFFAWHEFKKEKEKKESYVIGQIEFDEEEEDPQSQLERGQIPDEFKRQMFYTFGDYRDICLGKDIGSDVTEVNKKLETILPNSLKTAGSKNGEDRIKWWDSNKEAIWDGMLCALSYNTDTKEMNNQLLTKIINSNKNKYKDVTFKGGFNGGTTKLEEFSRRPTFFRWLEEWGEEFCKKRTDKLKKLEKECRGVNYSGYNKYCSGDGYHCDDEKGTYNSINANLNCRDCMKECRNYKTWIVKKKNEYDKQKSKYVNEHENVISFLNKQSYKQLYENIKPYSSAADFFTSLNHCKPDKANDDKNNKLNFKNPHETFSPSTYCKACPLNGVICRGRSQCAANSENNLTNLGESTDFDILINDAAIHDNDNEIKKGCPTYEMYKDLRKQKWICQKKTGEVHQCKLNNAADSKYYDNKFPFNILFHRWITDFIQYYNKSKEKIKPCTNDVNSCKQGCKGNCDCVDKWLKNKSTEWEIIKKYYKENFGNTNEHIAYAIKIFLQEGLFDSDYKRAQEVIDQNEWEQLWGCTGDNLKDVKDQKAENCNKGDFITNLISKLQDKITSCQNKHNPNGKTACDETLPHSDEEENFEDTPTTDDSQSPAFCPPPPPPMTCVEKAAQKVRIEAEENAKKNDKNLKGQGKDFNNVCKNIKKNDTPANGKGSCEFEQTYKTSLESLNETCKGNGKERFEIGQKWNSKYIKKIRKHLYIPPRREHMCINHLKEINRYTDTDSNSLLKKIQEAAKSEGDDIIKNLLLQNPCNENIICDAMKYSFADLGDIIRGRDLLSNDKDQLRIQRRLINAFTKIYSNLERSKQTKYQKDITNLYELRSDWWDANRKEVWNAMTCNAPKDAKLNKRNEEPEGTSTNGSFVSTLDNCGYEKDPPDYDYIPQPFRWMQEWSEYYCKLLNKELDNFKNQCSDCQRSSTICTTDIEKCTKCKEQCKKYKKLVDQWKLQFNKYKETYDELYNNNNKAKISSEEYVNKFLEKLKDECKGKDSADKYLDEASHCKKYKFTIDSVSNNSHNYAFENPPKGYKDRCECQVPDPLDQCPKNDQHLTVCKNFFPTKLYQNKTFNNDVDIWTNHFIQKSPGNYTGVLVPPRRRELCIKNITANFRSIEKNKEVFKTELMNCAYNEGKLLCELYKKDRDVTLQAMKYSFADYGDIVKGTDLISTAPLDKLKTKLNVLLKGDGTNEITEERKKWWTNNRTQVWNAMLCGYKKAGGTIGPNDCNIPSEENTHQFLRWFQEWTEHFCARQKELYQSVKKECESATCDSKNGIMEPADCEEACTQYRDYITRKIQEYRSLKHQYNTNFNEKKAEVKNAAEYFNAKCNDKCNCLSKYIDIEKQWKNMYDSFDDNDLKEKCICRQIKPKRPPKKVKREEEHTPSEQDTPPPLPPKPDDLPPPAEEPFNRDILEKTIPFGIALALSSIAFLFLKKKPKSPVDLIRVLDIHKGDYEMPTLKSKNRYIPYRSGTYKGKTYIYMEGDTSGDEKYAFMSDTTDVTSSESEYEEMDINDIYVPRAPKYKTLIEVVLEPSGKLSGNTIPTSGKNTPSDTQNDIQNDDIPSSDIPHTNKFTDDEWNQLKKDFISNMLQNQPKDVPNDYTSGNSSTNTNITTTSRHNVDNNTHPTMSRDNMEEKPFITSIHDRNLYTGEEINYNINMSTNSMDDPKYVSNNVYSGIDLINDTLSGNQHIDIYDEVLKRKENELFGTNHTKNTSNNSVAKLTNSDPIINQLNLFHTWLDRHRDMCEQWNNKEDILNKLNEEWNKDNDRGNVPIDNKTLNTDVSIQIHMDNPKPINEFTNMDTILDDLDKYNEPYYDVQDDIYYDVHDHDTSTVDSNNMDIPSKVQIEMDVNSKLVKEKYPIGDVWDI